jgi:hypothetical protein
VQKKCFVHLPRICIQLLLPESQVNLDSLLSSYAAPAGHTTPHSDAASRIGSAASGHKAVTATHVGIGSGSAAVGAACRSGNANAFGDVLARVMLKARDEAGTCNHPGASPLTPTDAAAPARSAADMQPAAEHGSSGSGSSSDFWQLFSSHVTVICISEVKYSLMGQSCLVCPGAVTLVSNLVHSVDSQALLHAQCEEAPLAVQEYLQGSTNELYEVCVELLWLCCSRLLPHCSC